VVVHCQLQRGESSGKQHLPGNAARGKQQQLLPLASASTMHPLQQPSGVKQLQQTDSSEAASLQLQRQQRRLVLLLARLLLLLQRLRALCMLRARAQL
jgi:hypothetical protein